MGLIDEAIQGGEVLGLFLRCDADQFHLGEIGHVEEIRVTGGEETAIFVAEDENEAIEAIGASMSK